MVGAAQKWQVGTLSGATNGASLNAFPGSVSPLSAMVLNLGLVQTRKSQITSAVQQVSDAIQARCRQRLMAREDADQRAKLHVVLHTDIFHRGGHVGKVQLRLAAVPDRAGHRSAGLFDTHEFRRRIQVFEVLGPCC